ncbi:cytochrome P450 [Streptomyces sp. NBC_01433]|uniref:cytochrome P450 n=1 Tax=Streptomyces sp. NBC_01433 TaxID=2903864 RepID=UPI00225087A4|nr:cytochrome P450 [Streptomyces sp. NBC_01433]MCX4674150.1 cytochrome P450 [Streptomyces sp. NBC_01433]
MTSRATRARTGTPGTGTDRHGGCPGAVTRDSSGLWLLTREADVRSALADPRLTVDQSHAGDGHRAFTLPDALSAHLQNRDGAEHARLRRLAAGSFSARRTQVLRGQVQATADLFADRLADRLTAHTPVDLVAEYALPLPLTVVADLLGVPADQRPQLTAWTAAMLNPTQPSHLPDAIEHVHHLILDLIETRRTRPTHNLLSTWVTACDQGECLSGDELVALAFQMWWAGVENVTHAISHGTLLLLRRPHLAHLLRSRPQTMPGLVEEILRHTLPTLSVRRFAREDLRIAGTRIRAGEAVQLALGEARHDTADFPDRDGAPAVRQANPHLAFGHGAHHCLGAALARLELQAAFTSLLTRIPGLTLAVAEDALRWRTSARRHGLTELPVSSSSVPKPSMSSS